jgi:hypothetical protein
MHLKHHVPGRWINCGGPVHKVGDPPVSGLICGEHMKGIVYHPKVETQDALLYCIFDAEHCIEDNLKELMHATCSIYECVSMYVSVEVSRFEHSL